MYREFRPDQTLLPFVECGWELSATAGAATCVLPDGCTDLFVTAGGEMLVSGPATSHYELPNEGVLCGLRLRPGAAAAVFGLPADELRDIRMPTDSICGINHAELSERLCSTTTPEQRITLLQTLLTAYFSDVEPVVDRQVGWAVRQLRARPDRPVSALAADIGLSERQLRRRFEAAVGYGPKRLGRVFRFQRLLDLIRACGERPPWAELAVMAGYADQSHMINECIALAGALPTALLAGRLSDSSNTEQVASP